MTDYFRSMSNFIRIKKKIVFEGNDKSKAVDSIADKNKETTEKNSNRKGAQ